MSYVFAGDIAASGRRIVLRETGASRDKLDSNAVFLAAWSDSRMLDGP